MDYIYKQDEIYVKNDDGSYKIHVTFPLYEEGVVNIDHTFVTPDLRGSGEASKMMHATMKYIESLGLKVVASCPYAVVWLKRHAEFNDMIRQDLQEHLGEECKIM